MELIILCGIQASGKSSFFKAEFADTHVRLNLDMLRTRYRELLLLHALLKSKTKFVVDNTNPTRAARAPYIAPAKAAGYSVIGYEMVTPVEVAVARNAERGEGSRVPHVAIYGTLRDFERPGFAEGFDELYRVVAASGRFRVRQVPPPPPPSPPPPPPAPETRKLRQRR